MEREVEVRVVRAGAEVDLVGRLDARSASLVRDALQECVDAGEGDLLLHVGELEIWDSTGLGVLVGRLKQIRLNDGSMRLVCSHDRVLKVFVITGLDKVFAIYPTVGEAVAAG
jgi:anti-sigma B factor antagonist